MQEAIKFCELDENKICDNCNKCNICDLDPNKLCDSCGKCLEIGDSEYKELKLDGIIDNELELDEYLFEIENTEDANGHVNDSNDDSELKVEYIEDIPELKEEYDKIIESILKDDQEPEHSHAHDHDHNCYHDHH